MKLDIQIVSVEDDAINWKASEETYDYLVGVAEEQGITLDQLVEKALVDYMEVLETR